MVARPNKRLFVEGGGDKNVALKSECRRGFRLLLEKAGLQGRMPRIIACGDRRSAYDQFCTALSNGDNNDVTILLVDAEAPFMAKSAWAHVKERQGDGWQKIQAANNNQLHLMVECMESWFLADKEALANFFGQGFNNSPLPANPKVEEVSKSDVFKGLKNATKDAQKGPYGKGAHSFKILAVIDPNKLRNAAPNADRFLTYLKQVL